MRPLLLASLLTLPLALAAQPYLSEAAPANLSLPDEDGDTPDWIELHNPTSSPLDLTGYRLSDRRDEPNEWAFAKTTLAPGAYALVWASGKDRQYRAAATPLVQRGDLARYLAPTEPVDEAWVTPGFDDATWASGPTGIGYGDGDDATEVPATSRAVLLRHRFSVADADAVRNLVLHVDYDDGFVAYLNGVEVARANMDGARPPFDALATRTNEAVLPQGQAPQTFLVHGFAALLRDGENVLAVQVHNHLEVSSDLSAVAYLMAAYDQPPAGAPAAPPELAVPARQPHAAFRLSSGGETVYLFDAGARLVDSLDLRGAPAYGSIGRPSADGPRTYYDTPTPGAPNTAPGFTRQLTGGVGFSRRGGPTAPFSLSLAAEGATERSVIRYTLDATEPTRTSPAYRGPLDIDATAVVRARLFGAADARPTDTETAVYLVGTDHDIDLASLTTAPDLLFDPADGIYVLGEDYNPVPPFRGANFWDGREVPMHFGFYPRDGTRGVTVDGGARIFGGYSRSFAQRSFAFFARGAYGQGSIDYPLFPERDYASFTSLVLRNSGNDWRRANLRDATLTGLMAGSGLDYADYRPVATYLNGDYWGLYNLREKINEDFLATRHGVDPDEVDLLEGQGWAIEGSHADYRALLAYIEGADLGSDAAFAIVADEIDLDNFATYQAAQVYFDNRDWPGNNVKFWRARDEDGAPTKWRWILYDTDFGAAIYQEDAYRVNTLAYAIAADGPGWPNPPWATFLLRRLLTNEGFRHRFINRAADQMNARFLPEVAVARIDRNADRIASEIDDIERRWGADQPWGEQLDRMRRFFRERPAYMRRYFREQFGLPAEHTLRISLPDTTQGYAHVNSLTVDVPSWAGTYFETVPVRVTAFAKTGYAFSHWRHDPAVTDATLVVDLTAARTLEPVFRADTSGPEAPPTLNSPITELRVGPNPTTGPLDVSFRLALPGAVTVTLTDVLGRPVREQSLGRLRGGPQQLNLDLAALPAGAYRMDVRSADGEAVGVLVVRR